MSIVFPSEICSFAHLVLLLLHFDLPKWWYSSVVRCRVLISINLLTDLLLLLYNSKCKLRRWGEIFCHPHFILMYQVHYCVNQPCEKSNYFGAWFKLALLSQPRARSLKRAESLPCAVPDLTWWLKWLEIPVVFSEWLVQTWIQWKDSSFLSLRCLL